MRYRRDGVFRASSMKRKSPRTVRDAYVEAFKVSSESVVVIASSRHRLEVIKERFRGESPRLPALVAVSGFKLSVRLALLIKRFFHLRNRAVSEIRRLVVRVDDGFQSSSP
jgi:hypothetical protein